MTVYGCSSCKERHNRLTTISAHGAVYYDDNGVATLDIGCCGCPQCATNCCPSCAEEIDCLCPCGGELVPNMMYHFNGDGRLPDAIARLPTTSERLEMLDTYRIENPMIEAEYRNLRFEIERCEEFTERNEGLPANAGVLLLRGFLKNGMPPIEAWHLITEYAVQENIDQLLSSFDKPGLDCVQRHLDHYPESDEGWQRLESDYHFEEYHPPHLVPRRTPKQIVDSVRFCVTLKRTAMVRRAEAK